MYLPFSLIFSFSSPVLSFRLMPRYAWRVNRDYYLDFAVFSYDISLSVCLFMCVYMMLVALSMCLRVGAGIVGGSQVFQ